jgi:hypothetical protein
MSEHIYDDAMNTSKLESTAAQLIELQKLLLARPMLRRAENWSDCFLEDSPDNWCGDWTGVYVLWKSQDDFAKGGRPVYVGEGILGSRIWDSFQNRKKWHYAQVLNHPLISGNSQECLRWRLALERFLILTLDPEENVG